MLALAGRTGLGDGEPSRDGALMWLSARHLLDLLKGYHAAARGQAWVEERRCRRGVPPSGGVIGLRQVEETALRHSGWGSGAFPERTPYPHPAGVGTR